MFRNPYADGLIVLLVILLFFGPKRLPTLGRSLGQGLREFKDSITGNSTDDDVDRPVLSSATPTPTPTSAPTAEREPVQSPSAVAGQAHSAEASHEQGS